ncbi:hypothetical protein [Methylobacterium sp. Leaf91]|uniref:hypothetical protein n=1 Tax=Methylobacterium sp. Leaf91 TaxID=1736247 RepID=UPI0007012B57|nr:hypothetical protein [Methylobacterium sp. Leaf91]KQO85930.1 hypothetical protein ASF32_09595 [Methylobacterium sp. Leaf91]
MAGVSGRALAKLLGISEGAVRKIRDTRLAGAKLPGGLFDPERARALYASNVDKAMQRERPSTNTAVSSPAPAAGPAAVMGRPEVAGPDVNKARAAWTMEKARREQIKRKVDEKSVIERAPAVTLVQALAREFREGLFRFPDKHAATMAAELGVDEHALYECLQKHFRAYLEKDIARVKAEVLG